MLNPHQWNWARICYICLALWLLATAITLVTYTPAPGVSLEDLAR